MKLRKMIEQVVEFGNSIRLEYPKDKKRPDQAVYHFGILMGVYFLVLSKYTNFSMWFSFYKTMRHREGDRSKLDVGAHI